MPRREIVPLGPNYQTERFYDDDGRLHNDEGPAWIASRIDPSLILVEKFFYHGTLRRELNYNGGLCGFYGPSTSGIVSSETMYDNFGNMIFILDYKTKAVTWKNRECT